MIGVSTMGQALISSHGVSRVLGPTSAATLATRMVATVQVIGRTLPQGFTGHEPVYILLALFVAREEGREPELAELNAPDICSEGTTTRWIAALVQHGLASRHGESVAITEIGNDLVMNCLEEIYAVQRQLDPPASRVSIGSLALR